MASDNLKSLQKLPLMQSLPPKALAQLAKKVEQRKFEKDEILFHKGDPGDSMYMIRTGWVKIVTTNRHGDEVVLNHAGPGEVVGDIALLDGEPRSTGTVALSEVSALELKRDVFMKVLEKQPQLALNVMQNLAGRLRFAVTYIEEAVTWTQRIAEGDYDFATQQLQDVQSTIVDSNKGDEARADHLLMGFFHMLEGIQEREENLKSQLAQLDIDIDETKREQQVGAISQSTMFGRIRSAAFKFRSRRDTTNT